MVGSALNIPRAADREAPGVGGGGGAKQGREEGQLLDVQMVRVGSPLGEGEVETAAARARTG